MTAAAEPWHARRWALTCILVVIAHGGMISLLGSDARPPVPVGEPAILIDMEPTPVADAAAERPPPEPSPLPDDPPPDPAPQAAETTPQPPLQIPDPPIPDPPAPDLAVPDPPAPDPVVPEPPTPEIAKPPVVIPRPAPTAQPKPALRARAPRPEEPKPATPSVNTAPPPAASAASANVPMSWKARLLAHLNRFKRYPADAQMRRRQGTAVVHLRLMPDGSVEAVRLETTSGTQALDQEAVALIGRAEPLPVPDADTTAIELAVPIQFSIR